MSYKILSQSSSDGRDNLNEDIPATQPLKGISYRHAIFLYILSAALTAALLISIAVRPYTLQNGPFGSYETGYKTEIVMNANALALKKVKFYGGILVSENGTYSLSHEQGTPDYFGLPGSETDHAWGQLVKDRYIGIDPQEWPPEALRPNKGKDLVRDKWWVEPSSLHALHCLNYVRRSFHPEYYTKYQDKSGPPDPEPHTNTHSMHLKHCLEQIRQHLTCQLDMTPTPRTWREGAQLHHADVDQWHVCRDLDAVRAWMYPTEEHHT